ncbi:MAG: hypothetical protein A3K53_05190 [Deltaproteobacteria bacterium RIFOXYB2_FULL_66_7]|nr:MAG: hypothetical protein A3K53_05190 [Deltaproteobacteria bacterium RIFOXYB2_FULL_66_7]
MDDATRRLHIDETLVKAQAAEANRVDDRRTEVNLAQARVTAAEQTRVETEARVGVAVAQVGAAKAARVSTDAALLAARARLETLRARLEDHFVRAPFAGVVTERIAEEGEIVAPVSIGGTQAKGAIVTVIESASMQAEVDVAERHLARVKPGGRARITVDAFPGEVFPGSVQRILPLVDRGKATVKARGDFRKVDPRFLPNMAVRVRFLPPDAPAGAEEGLVPDPLLVPTAAVVTRDSQPGVWTVDGDRVRHVPVKTGATRGDQIEITEGLAEGATVVVKGVAALRRDGQRIRVRQTEGRL